MDGSQHGADGEDDEGDATATTDGHENDGADEGDGAAGGETRRRTRRPIIAIGTAGVSRRSGGRLHMEDLRWNRFYVGGNAHRNASTDEVTFSLFFSHFSKIYFFYFQEDGRPRDDDGVGRSDNGNRTGEHMPVDEDIRDELDCEQRLLLSGAVGTDGHRRAMDFEQEQQERMEEVDLPPLVDESDGRPTRTSDGSELPQSVDGTDLPPLTDGSESEEDVPDVPKFTRIREEPTSTKSEMTSRSIAGSTGIPTVSSGTGESSKRCHSESENPELEARRKRAAAHLSTFESPPICQAWRGLGSDGDSDASDEESETRREQQRQLRHDNVNMQKKFSEAMSSKILMLPVPDSVKAYLNYYRK